MQLVRHGRCPAHTHRHTDTHLLVHEVSMLCVVWRVGVVWHVALFVVFQQRTGAARLTLMEEVDRWLHEGEVRARVREVEGSRA